MSRLITPTDSYAIINLIAKQATGQQALTATNTASFVSVGEQILSTGRENVLNSIAIVMGRLIVASRAYAPKLQLIEAVNTDMYTNRLRKISYYASDALQAGHVNTNAKTNLADGYDNGSNSGNSVASMWEQNFKSVAEVDFAGSDVWQYCMTITDNQLKIAFRDETEFGNFIAGYIQECGNDIATEREAFNRLTLLNKIAATIDMSSVMDGSAVNLRTAFNDYYGTNYSVQDLLGTYRKELLAFFVAQFKLASDFMTNRTAKYHWPMTNSAGEKILRHTPKDKQRAILYAPFFIESESQVLPAIFNPQYLSIGQYEMTEGWQTVGSPAINVTPAIPDITGAGTGQTAGNAVNIGYVLGILYDVDGMLTDFQMDSAMATPMEARKRYYNVWTSFAKNAIVDNTENTVVFYLA